MKEYISKEELYKRFSEKNPHLVDMIPQIEMAVEMLGADRIIFATDNSPSACVGKILGARISEEDKKTILSGRAFSRFLERKVK